MTQNQVFILQSAIDRVEAQKPDLLKTDGFGFTQRVVFLCRKRDPYFGLKRNPSGAISHNTIGLLVDGTPPPHFEAIDFMHYDSGNQSGNYLRGRWLKYKPGPQSDGTPDGDYDGHVGPDQEWIDPVSHFTDVYWPEDEPIPEPEPPPADVDERIASALERIADTLEKRFG